MPFKDLNIAKKEVYEKCNFLFTNLQLNSESQEYDACSFKLNENKIEYRKSKITPKKTGQFVAIWKRNQKGETVPFDVLDELDFMIISVRDHENFGQFIFPKTILMQKGVISQNGQSGKRGIRVYAPWHVVSNQQANKTKLWQNQYFVEINGDLDIQSAKKRFTN